MLTKIAHPPVLPPFACALQEMSIYRGTLPHERNVPDMGWMRVPVIILGLFVVAITQGLRQPLCALQLWPSTCEYSTKLTCHELSAIKTVAVSDSNAASQSARRDCPVWHHVVAGLKRKQVRLLASRNAHQNTNSWQVGSQLELSKYQ